MIDLTRRTFLRGLFSAAAAAATITVAEQVIEPVKAIILLGEEDRHWYVNIVGKDGVTMYGSETLSMIRSFMLDHRQYAPFQLCGYRDPQPLMLALRRYGDDVALVA